MSHVRTQLRQALQAALTSLPTTGPRVEINRSAPVSAARAPCLLITTPSERAAQIGTLSVPRVMRTVTVVIEAVAAGADLDAQLDQIGLEVEQAMAGVGLLGGLIKSPPQYSEMQMDREDTASPPVGYLRMAWQCDMATTHINPDIPI
ncbi:MAG: hypothetical protein PHE98_10245 [Thauera propionica]|nr:hypothetical protein [Thauera propionica]